MSTQALILSKDMHGNISISYAPSSNDLHTHFNPNNYTHNFGNFPLNFIIQSYHNLIMLRNVWSSKFGIDFMWKNQMNFLLCSS